MPNPTIKPLTIEEAFTFIRPRIAASPETELFIGALEHGLAQMSFLDSTNALNVGWQILLTIAYLTKNPTPSPTDRAAAVQTTHTLVASADKYLLDRLVTPQKGRT